MTDFREGGGAFLTTETPKRHILNRVKVFKKDFFIST